MSDALACETATPGRWRQVASVLVGATVAATGCYQTCGALLRARLPSVLPDGSAAGASGRLGPGAVPGGGVGVGAAEGPHDGNGER